MASFGRLRVSLRVAMAAIPAYSLVTSSSHVNNMIS
jgi:hypothetical protein